MEKACQLIVKRGERGRGATRLIYTRNRAADPRERERKREGEREREIFGRARHGGRRRACTHALKWNAFHLVGHFRGCHPLAPAPCIVTRSENSADTDLRTTQAFVAPRSSFRIIPRPFISPFPPFRAKFSMDFPTGLLSFSFLIINRRIGRQESRWINIASYYV